MAGKPEIKINGSSRVIGGDESCFIIAEIGQNHQGDMNLAQQLIKVAAKAGADCVKFQKYDIKSKFNASALAEKYAGRNSFGTTYGEHKQALNLTDEQFNHLKDYANNEGILFAASAMDRPSVDFLVSLGVPFIKLGSGDINNYPLIRYTAQRGIPLILSTGMSSIDVIKTAYNEHARKFTTSPIGLLHCVSSYPSPYSEIDLRVLASFREQFSDAVIGYSGHESGIEVSIAAVALGAKILERHLTLDHQAKGTDHEASLEPSEFTQLVSSVRNVERALSGSGIKVRQPSEMECYQKLGKSLVAARDLCQGDFLMETSVTVKVARPQGIPAENYYSILGRKIQKDLHCDESITYDHLAPQ